MIYCTPLMDRCKGISISYLIFHPWTEPLATVVIWKEKKHGLGSFQFFPSVAAWGLRRGCVEVPRHYCLPGGARGRRPGRLFSIRGASMGFPELAISLRHV